MRRDGFEPPRCHEHDRFTVCCLQPLSHLPEFCGGLLPPKQAVAYSRPRLAVTRAGTVALQTSRALPRLSGGKCRIRTCEALWARPLSRRVLSTAQPTFRGGSGRIRTLGAFRPIGFLDRCLKPLSHTSGVWEELGPGACNFPVSPAFTASSSPLDPFSSSRRCCLLLTRKQPTGRSEDPPVCTSSGELSPLGAQYQTLGVAGQFFGLGPDSNRRLLRVLTN